MHPITNEHAYLRSMIYNSLSGDYLKLTSKVQYSALGRGRSNEKHRIDDSAAYNPDEWVKAGYRVSLE